MLTEQAKFDGVLTAIKAYVPGFSTSLKSKSWFHKVLGKVLSKLGNKFYMDLYWTTIGKTVYRPTLCDSNVLEGEWRVILHEGRHADDCYKLGFLLYSFLYLFPQIFGLLGLLYAIVILPVLLLGGPLGLLWGLMLLLFLAPIPSLPRAIMELRAYVVSLACDFWSDTMGDEEVYLDNITNRFTTGAYYYMWPFKGMIRNYFKNRLEDLKTGSLEMDSYLFMCRSKCFSYK